MDDKKLEALAKELAKDIKSEKDLSALSRRLGECSIFCVKLSDSNLATETSLCEQEWYKLKEVA